MKPFRIVLLVGLVLIAALVSAQTRSTGMPVNVPTQAQVRAIQSNVSSYSAVIALLLQRADSIRRATYRADSIQTATINALKLQVQNQQTTIGNQQATLTAQQSTLTSQQGLIATQQATLVSQQNSLTLAQSNLTKQTGRIDSTRLATARLKAHDDSTALTAKTAMSTAQSASAMAGAMSFSVGNGLPEWYDNPKMVLETAPMWAVGAATKFLPLTGRTYTRCLTASKGGLVTRLEFNVLVAATSLGGAANDNAVAIYDSAGVNRLSLQNIASLLTTASYYNVPLTTPFTIVRGKRYCISLLSTGLSLAQLAAHPAAAQINKNGPPYAWGFSSTTPLAAALNLLNLSDGKLDNVPWFGLSTN